MNYIAFLSVGVFAALLFVIGAHYNPDSNNNYQEYSPTKIVAVIKAKQREQVLIARREHNIKVDESVIAAWEGEKLNQFASVPTPSPIADDNSIPTTEAAFGVDAWYQWSKSVLEKIFSSSR